MLTYNIIIYYNEYNVKKRSLWKKTKYTIHSLLKPIKIYLDETTILEMFFFFISYISNVNKMFVLIILYRYVYT